MSIFFVSSLYNHTNFSTYTNSRATTFNCDVVLHYLYVGFASSVVVDYILACMSEMGWIPDPAESPVTSYVSSIEVFTPRTVLNVNDIM